MSARCPDGHLSESTDYCDVCGLPMGAAPPSASPVGPTVAVPVSAGSSPSSPSSPSSTDKACPNCQTLVPVDDLFCEVCGYDFTTGALPSPVVHPGGVPVEGGPAEQAAVTPAPHAAPSAGSTAAAAVGSAASPSTAAPAPALEWVAEVWVDPDWYATQESDEPCPSVGMPMVAPLRVRSVLVGRRSVSRAIHPEVDCGADHGVSRRHAQLTTDGQRWWVEDLQSANGTFVGAAGAPMPTVSLTPGQRREFVPGDRLYVGAWTRIVVREATDDEQ